MLPTRVGNMLPTHAQATAMFFLHIALKNFILECVMGYWAIWQVIAQVCGVLPEPKVRVYFPIFHIISLVLLVHLRISLADSTGQYRRNSYSAQYD